MIVPLSIYLNRLRCAVLSLRHAPDSFSFRPKKDIGRFALSNAKWNMALMFLRQAFSVLGTAVLARFLLPSDFGLLSMVLLITAFFGLIDLALGWTAVQSADLDSKAVSNLFWIGALWGLLIWTTCILLAPLLARLLRQPELSGICVVMGAAVFCNSLATQPLALLKRQMQQFAVASIETIAVVGAGTIAVCLALGGFGYWALVAQAVVTSFIRLVLALFLSPLQVMRPMLTKADARRLKFGSYMGACHWVIYIQQSLDSALVAWLFGASSVGLYSRAIGLKNLPTLYTVQPLNDIMVPALAAVREDNEHLRRAYLKALKGVAFVGAPAGAFLGVAAPQLVRLLYGPNWVQVVPLMYALALSATVWPIHSTASWLLISTGSSRLYFWTGILLLFVSACAYVWIAGSGMLSVAVMHSLLLGLLSPALTLYLAHRITRMPLRPTLQLLGKVFLACLIAVAAACCAGAITPAHWMVVLAMKGLAGSVAYVFMIYKLFGEIPLPIRSFIAR